MKFDKTILLVIIVVIAFFPSCTSKKKIRLIGYAFKGDNIILQTDHNRYPKIVVNGKEDKNNICLFNENFRWMEDANDIRLTIQLDSMNVKLLDTTVVIPKHFKEPFISFIEPSFETSFSRRIFVDDEGASNFLKE